MSIYKHHILIVDDDLTVFESAKIILDNRYNCSYAENGKAAVNFFNQGNNVDLILMDIVMPELDGYETLAQIKKIKACRFIPVIFLTGATEARYELKALKSGAKDFISKPFNPAVFLARIELCIFSENNLLLDKLSEAADDLTTGDLTILKLIAKGYSNEDVSQELHYSYGYTKQLVSKLFEKLGITGRKELKQFYRN